MTFTFKEHTKAVSVVGVLVVLIIVLFITQQSFFKGGSSVDTRVLQALDSYHANDFASALEQADRLIASTNQKARVAGYVIRASVLVQQASFAFDEEGGAQEAIAAAAQALALEPDNAEALRVTGYAYEIMENYEKADEYYDLSLAVDPDNPETLTSKGHSLDLQGKIEEARALYMQALAIDDAYEPALLHMMRIHQRFEEYPATKAIAATLTQSANINVRATAWQVQGAILLSEFDFEAALDAYTKALEANPNDPSILTGAAEASFESHFWTTNETNYQEMIDAVEPYLSAALSKNMHHARAYLLRYRMYSYVFDVTGLVEHQMKKNEAKQKTLESVASDITLTATEKEAISRWFEIETEVLEANL